MIERLRVRIPAGAAADFFFFSKVNFFSVLTLIRCPFHPRDIAVARKRPWSFSQRYRWQATPKRAYTLTQRSLSGLTMLFRHSVGTYHGGKFTCSSSENTPSQSSQFAKPLWIDPGLRSGTVVHELIHT